MSIAANDGTLDRSYSRVFSDPLVAKSLFLAGVWIFSLPFVYHAFTIGAGYILTGASKHPALAVGSQANHYAIAFHMATGAMMNFLVPMQVYLGLSRKRRSWHRVIGYASIVTALIGASVGSIYFSLYPDSNLVERSTGLYQSGAMYGVVMFYVIYRVVQTLVKRDFKTHREWAIRLFALSIGSYLFRVMMSLSGGALHLAGVEFSAVREYVLITNGWAFYLLPLLTIEVYYYMKKSGRFAGLPTYAPIAVSLAGTSLLGLGSVLYVLARLM